MAELQFRFFKRRTSLRRRTAHLRRALTRVKRSRSAAIAGGTGDGRRGGPEGFGAEACGRAVIHSGKSLNAVGPFFFSLCSFYNLQRFFNFSIGILKGINYDFDMKVISWVPRVLVMNLLCFPGHAQTMKPEQVHAFVSPSVALIEDVGSHGSGVVLTNKGQILTNFHVVASGLPVNVTIKVKKNGHVVNQRFENVPVELVHPEYDLALLQVPLSGAVCAPARYMPAEMAVKTGSVCFAIGNPGDHEGRSLTHSITEGLVSSATREIDGLEYIQISTALNPGNSGGAVADDAGRVIGIATWKLGQAENIGFAIPMKRVKVDDFIPLEKKAKNQAEAEKYMQSGGLLFSRAMQLQGEERKLALHYAVLMYRKGLEGLPNHPAILHNLGLMYSHLEEYNIAIAYLRKAHELRPKDADTLEVLGRMLIKVGRPSREAVHLWMQGLNDEDPVGVGNCADAIAVSYLKNQKYVEAAYFAKWALSNLNPGNPGRIPARKDMWQKSSSELNEPQFRYLRDKSEGFSLKDMQRYAALSGGAPPEEKESDPVLDPSMSYPSSMEQLSLQANILRKDAVALPPEGVKKPLPAKPAEILHGYAGTCLILHFPELNQLGIFDLNKATITTFLPLKAKKVRIAAGGTVLLIHYPDQGIFEMWDMRDWKMKKEFSYRSADAVSHMGMGLMNHHFAVLIRPEANSKIAILHLPSGKITEPKLEKKGDGLPLLHFTAHLNANSRVFINETGTSAVVTGGGRGVLDLRDLNKLGAIYTHTGGNVGNLDMSKSGTHIISMSDIYPLDDRLGLRSKIEGDAHRGKTMIGIGPVLGYDGYVELSAPSQAQKDYFLYVKSIPNFATVFKSALRPEVFHDARFPSSLSGRQDKIVASLYSRRCAVVDRENKTVTLLRLDDIVNAKKESLATPGENFQMNLDIPEGVKVVVQSAPAGMAYDEVEQTLSWNIPGSQQRGAEVSVILLLIHPDSTEEYRVEKIVVP